MNREELHVGVELDAMKVVDMTGLCIPVGQAVTACLTKSSPCFRSTSTTGRAQVGLSGFSGRIYCRLTLGSFLSTFYPFPLDEAKTSCYGPDQDKEAREAPLHAQLHLC